MHIGDHVWFWLSYLDPLTYLPEKTFNLFDFPVFWLWAWWRWFQSFDFERTWWRLFQKRIVCIKLDIYGFIALFVRIIFLFLILMLCKMNERLLYKHVLSFMLSLVILNRKLQIFLLQRIQYLFSWIHGNKIELQKVLTFNYQHKMCSSY